jgi:UDP-N-acetylglucosamine--N-acetylmuramyl-(pentapeptide) pyrophosphoryl-undecaprenol N-acetylglucosamine transferase
VTGGHIYPAIAIGDRFKSEDPTCEIIYIAGGHPLEREIIPNAGYELFEVHSEPLYRGSLAKAGKTLANVMKGRAEAVKIMKKFKPDLVVSTGSYVSVPIVLAARKMGADIYIHEQNGFPGISNKALAGLANRVFLGFTSAAPYFKNDEILVYSGNPVRAEFNGRDRARDRKELGIDENDLVVMVFGGSQGSETTNMVGEALAREYAGKEGVCIIWGTGDKYYEDIKKKLETEGFGADNIRIMPYISDMPMMLSACDITISRSGALSVAETTMAGRAAIFIPSPNVTEDHQYYNAKAVADIGGAFIVREDNGAEALVREIKNIIESLGNDREEIIRMGEASHTLAPVNATDIIYDTIMETLGDSKSKRRRIFGRR